MSFIGPPRTGTWCNGVSIPWLALYSDTDVEPLAFGPLLLLDVRTKANADVSNWIHAMTQLHDADLSPTHLEDVPLGYPRELEEWVTLSGGDRIYVRPIAPVDADRVAHALEFGDPETIQRRFLTGAPPKGHGAIEYLVTLDYAWRLALIAMDERGNSMGVGRYEGSEDNTTAEVAIVVDPQSRQRGVGSVLLNHLEGHARSVGVEKLVGLYQPGNTGVAALLKSIGYGPSPMADGLVCVTKSLM